MTLAVRVLAGLLAGFLLGLAVAGSSSPAAAITVGIVTPVGTIFVNLIRMTVIPLVVSMLVASVGAMTGSGGLGRTGVRALLISVGLLTTAATGSVLIAEPILASIRIDQAAALTLRGPTAGTSPSNMVASGAPTLATWLVDLVPPNVVKAAADGAMLPLILFAVVFGLALTRVSHAKREAVLRVVEGIAETMQRLVVWILGLAPIGVFALAVPLAARLGLAAAGAVIAYLALVVARRVADDGGKCRTCGPPTGFVPGCAPTRDGGVSFWGRCRTDGRRPFPRTPLWRDADAGAARVGDLCGRTRFVHGPRYSRRRRHCDGARVGGGQPAARGRGHPARGGHHTGHVSDDGERNLRDDTDGSSTCAARLNCALISPRSLWDGSSLPFAADDCCLDVSSRSH
jgi:hypothetical protein